MQKVIARRLKNAPKGEPYGVDVVECKSAEEANELAAKWWESRGTAAVLVMVGTVEDARYEREWIDRERIPADWIGRKGLAKDMIEDPSKRPESPLPEQPEIEPEQPTLFNDLEEEVRGEVADTAAGPRCPCCGHLRPDGGYGERPRDRTPSGRMADGRCLECGAPQPGVALRQLWAQYMAHQNRLNAEHRKKPSPWNPGPRPKR